MIKPISRDACCISEYGVPKWLLKNPGCHNMYTQWIDFKTTWLICYDILYLRYSWLARFRTIGHCNLYLNASSESSLFNTCLGWRNQAHQTSRKGRASLDHSIGTLSYWTPPEWRLKEKESRQINEWNGQNQDTRGDAEIIRTFGFKFGITLWRRDSYSDFILDLNTLKVSRGIPVF